MRVAVNAAHTHWVPSREHVKCHYTWLKFTVQIHANDANISTDFSLVKVGWEGPTLRSQPFSLQSSPPIVETHRQSLKLQLPLVEHTKSYYFTVKWHTAGSYQSKPAVRPSMRTLRSRPQSCGLSTVTELSEYLQPETAHWHSLQSRCIPPVHHYCWHGQKTPNMTTATSVLKSVQDFALWIKAAAVLALDHAESLTCPFFLWTNLMTEPAALLPPQSCSECAGCDFLPTGHTHPWEQRPTTIRHTHHHAM